MQHDENYEQLRSMVLRTVGQQLTMLADAGHAIDTKPRITTDHIQRVESALHEMLIDIYENH